MEQNPPVWEDESSNGTFVNETQVRRGGFGTITPEPWGGRRSNWT